MDASTADPPLKRLAIFAAAHHIQGRSFKRNSLIKPLDILLDQLEASPHPDDPVELATVRAAVKSLIFAHLERIAKPGFTPGRGKLEQVGQFVDQFFDGVLGLTYRGRVAALLGRVEIVRAAYLLWLREALAARQPAKVPGATTPAEDDGSNDDDENREE